MFCLRLRSRVARWGSRLSARPVISGNSPRHADSVRVPAVVADRKEDGEHDDQQPDTTELDDQPVISYEWNYAVVPHDLEQFMHIVFLDFVQIIEESTSSMAPALSPRSVNIRSKKATSTKLLSEQNQIGNLEKEAQAKAAAIKRAEKEKNLASPPPTYVIQPPGLHGVLGEKYATGRFLGKGGFAICYEAQLVGKKHGNKVAKFALKIVKAKMNVKKLEEKFRTELQIHSRMRHPNIVEFHRAFTFQENTYIVLELCPNGSVMDMIKRRQCLSLPEVRRYAVQLCGAIKYMHKRGVIHRDLKMGNIFLDHNMDIKLGDFGLAALLVSENEVKGAARRTTMCGTPNYLAPEIVEKRMGGHDHKVDIWAIGIILFAIITGYPPFQSTSQDDIYRKVKSIEYEWPEEVCPNEIPEEAKSLVASLLKSDAEERPDPDQIVAHPFFSMHRGNAIPFAIEPNCRSAKPQWLEESKPRGDVMSSRKKRIDIITLCQQCGVGFYPSGKATFPIVGKGIGQSMYVEIVAEDAAGLMPVVPLPEDTVYSYSDTPPMPPTISSAGFSTSRLLENASIGRQYRPNVSSAGSIPGGLRSHAATLRAQACTRVPLAREFTTGEPAKDSSTPKRHRSTTIRSNQRSSQALLENLPIRPTLNSVPSSRGAQTLPRGTKRITRSTTANAENEAKPKQAQLDTARANIPCSVSTPEVANYQDSPPAYTEVDAASNEKRGVQSGNPKSTVDSEVQEENPQDSAATNEALRGRLPQQVRSDADSMPAYTRPHRKGQEFRTVLISQHEVAECLPGTKPIEIVENLKTLFMNIFYHLQSTDGKYDPTLVPPTGSENLEALPIVVRWLDYTNKFGIGYILANGNVGCVFNGGEGRHSTSIVVPDAEDHLKKRKFTAYSERHQPVPKDGAWIEFFENAGEAGIRRVYAPPTDYQVEINEHGVPEKLSPGTNSHENEKRRAVSLWDKFGSYMTDTLVNGTEDLTDLASESLDAKTSPDGKKHDKPSGATSFVKFYQRLGNVGVWGFGDGGFQFNFPDHTKLIISNDGAWADFYHLSLKGADALAKGRVLDQEDLDERTLLSYPLRILLQGGYKYHNFKRYVEANNLRRKVLWVTSLLAQWKKNGGLGRMGTDKKLEDFMWKGAREIVNGNEKLIWVTCGAWGGDWRRETVAS